MQNYVGNFPDVPRKHDILGLIGSFRFALAFPESDFDIRGSDECVKWIHALCGHLDGVIFTPSQLLDANGRVLISCDGRSDATAVLPAVHQATAEPVAIASDTLDEHEPEPPPANRVAKRAMVLVAVANRGFVEHQRLTIDRPDEIRIAMLKWIDAIDANDEIEPDEWKVLHAPSDRSMNAPRSTPYGVSRAWPCCYGRCRATNYRRTTSLQFLTIFFRQQVISMSTPPERLWTRRISDCTRTSKHIKRRAHGSLASAQLSLAAGCDGLRCVLEELLVRTV